MGSLFSDEPPSLNTAEPNAESQNRKVVSSKENPMLIGILIGQGMCTDGVHSG